MRARPRLAATRAAAQEDGPTPCAAATRAWHVSCFDGRRMLPRHHPSNPEAALRARRHCLLGALVLLATEAVRAEGAAAVPAAPASSSSRLRFRTRRAACDCAGDIDDEAIERAMAGRAAAPASGAAGGGTDKPAEKSRSATTNTRRPAP